MRFDDERELEALIVELNEKNGYCKVVDETAGRMERQVNIPGYGYVDILGFWADGDPSGVTVYVNLYELKNTTISCKDVGQISRYYIGVKRYIRNVYKAEVEDELQIKNRIFDINIRGILVGSGYENGDVCYLVDSIPWLECYHFSLGVNGVDFNLSLGWHHSDEADSKQTIKTLDIDKCLVSAYKDHLSINRRFSD